jgi:hypothetical protein
MIKLGDRVIDVVSGFEGIAVAKTIWLTGCERIGIEGPAQKDKGGECNVFWADTERCKVINKDAYKKAQQDTDPAGPMSRPMKSNDPK